MSECCPTPSGAAPDPTPFPMADSAAEPAASPCCAPPVAADDPGEIPGYRAWPFLEGWVETPAGRVPRVSTALALEDHLGRWQMRWGLGRDRYRIAPGLYAVGEPGAEAEVLVTANYKLTFDELRRRLAGQNLWLLVLETYGINVWCAAGKGTFGTDEVVRRVEAARLGQVVAHRRLILPQLGAPGVAAHEVQKRCGFAVEYGPVRAADLPAYLAAGRAATPAMRRVTFTALERLVLTPVELAMFWRRSTLWVLLGLFLFSGLGPGWFSPAAAWQRGWAAAGAGLTGVLAGAVVTPVLLPWLPSRLFAVKGAVAGGVLGALLLVLAGFPGGPWGAAALLLAVGAVASYAAMNFTGATPFTSPSGVEAEMRRALPFQVGAAALAAISWFLAAFG